MARRAHLCMPFAAAALLLLTACCSPAGAVPEVKVSKAAPGGLAPSDTPQFILWSHDDEVSAASTKLVLEVADARTNPNGCHLPLTWFACTSPACTFECDQVVEMYGRGHEIGTHTVDHAGLRWFEMDGLVAQIADSVEDVIDCGLPASAVAGFRCPYLADKPEVRQVLAEQGFRYDSTIGVAGGPDKPWPATLEDGVPYDCTNSDNMCSPDESYPGMWEIPLYESTSDNLMDYCTVEGEGGAKEGCSAYDTLVATFEEAYGGNRAPMTIGVHKQYMQTDEFRSDLGRFFDYALAKPDVWVVTHSQLLDWMEAPVPASEMESFMSKYTCP